MFDASLLPYLSALVFGTALGFICGLIPGLGSRVGLILAIPLCVFWDPYPAAIFLSRCMRWCTPPRRSRPSPSRCRPPAPMRRRSSTAIRWRAWAAPAKRSAPASAPRRSAACWARSPSSLAVPIARPIVTSFGPPEFLLLSLIGISLISAVSREGMMHGLAVAAIGVLCAMVGLSVRTGEPRLTFGLPELWDGLDLPALVAGLFIIPEMLTPTRFADDGGGTQRQAHHDRGSVQGHGGDAALSRHAAAQHASTGSSSA